MSDIVEQLRKAADEIERLREEIKSCPGCWIKDVKIMQLTAEIGRLTAALQHISYAYDLPNAGEECAEIARRALTEICSPPGDLATVLPRQGPWPVGRK